MLQVNIFFFFLRIPLGILPRISHTHSGVYPGISLEISPDPFSELSRDSQGIRLEYSMKLFLRFFKEFFQDFLGFLQGFFKILVGPGFLHGLLEEFLQRFLPGFPGFLSVFPRYYFRYPSQDLFRNSFRDFSRISYMESFRHSFDGWILYEYLPVFLEFCCDSLRIISLTSFEIPSGFFHGLLPGFPQAILRGFLLDFF